MAKTETAKKQTDKRKDKRKKTVIRIVEETYVGEMTIEEAFQKAFEPYFSKA